MRRPSFVFYIVVGLISAYIITACVISRRTTPLEAQVSGMGTESADEKHGSGQRQPGDTGPRRVAETPGIEQEGPARRKKAEKFTGREVLSAMQAAYPDRILEVAQRKGDWALRIDDTWFYWAGGRLLPEKVLDKMASYDPYPFYRYPKELPPIEELTDEEKKEIRERLKKREADPSSRHPGFYKALWRIDDRSTSWDRVKTIYFLGIKAQIHRDLLEDLAQVEEEILRKAASDGELARFVDSLVDLAGYNWRRIAGTASLSFHSFGTALDILPRSYEGKQAYWRWAKSSYTDWFVLPYSERYYVPPAFVEAFEEHGFIWGGKWFYFDNIHFEYRPEILILNGFKPD
jgi:hypothetical protein